MATTRPTYVRGVSFDTMTDQDQPDYTLTLRGKTPGYQRTRRSRTFMIATDLSNHTDDALDYTLDNLIDDGDEIIVLRVSTIDLNENKFYLQQTLKKEELQSKEKSNAVMNKIMATGNADMKVSAVIEFVLGKIQETIQNMIAAYQPSMLIVGTRGVSELKEMFINSVSKYCLQHSPIPVMVVKPDEKKKPKKLKRPNALSNMFRMNSFSHATETEEEHPPASPPVVKPPKRSVFEKIGRRSRSLSPSRPKK
ncbi:hypothetical protein BY458DRAFT_528348 [Sporodiniella umbellata]|nr:hypothetical protein BY458DRAFT_528348 [Sporodiniella umbellata]